MSFAPFAVKQEGLLNRKGLKDLRKGRKGLWNLKPET